MQRFLVTILLLSFHTAYILISLYVQNDLMKLCIHLPSLPVIRTHTRTVSSHEYALNSGGTGEHRFKIVGHVFEPAQIKNRHLTPVEDRGTLMNLGETCHHDPPGRREHP